MKTDPSSLVFMWLLMSCSAMTTGQTHNLPTAQEASTLGPGPPRSGDTGVSPTGSPQTEAWPTSSTQPNLSQLLGTSTSGPAEGSGRPGTSATADVSTETTPTLGQDASSPSHSTDVTSIPASPPPGTTVVVSTTGPPTLSTTPPNAPTLSTNMAILLLTSPSVTTTTKNASKPQKNGAAPGRKAAPGAHPVVVSSVIGGALVLMMLSFLLIYIRKRRLAQQQLASKNWAGPSPFIEDGRDGGREGARSSQRISLSSFLPQRMSRRLSLLPEADEELEDMSTTFGDRHQEAPTAQQGANGRGGAAGTKDTSVQAASPQKDVPASPDLTDHLPPNGVGETAQG